MVAAVVPALVVVKVLVWDAAMVSMISVVEVLVVEAWVDVEIFAVGVLVIVLEFVFRVSDSIGVTVGVFTDARAGVILRGLTAIAIEVFAAVNTTAFAVGISVLEFPVITSLEGFNRCAAFDSRPLALLDCDRVLQTWMPSYHVCLSLALPALPQFLNQEPLLPQQLISPDFAMMPHLGHTELMIVVVVAAGVHM